MSSDDTFLKQMDLVTSLFKDWSDCEQTIALCSLLKKSSPTQARFLEQILQQWLAEYPGLKHLEAQASDEDYVRSLCNENREEVIQQFLLLLPLLQVGQDSVKEAYLQTIHDLLQHTMVTGAHYQKIQELLSYSLMHPAVTAEERRNFQSWLRCLEERFTPRSAQSYHETTSCPDVEISSNNSNPDSFSQPSLAPKTPLPAPQNSRHAPVNTQAVPPAVFTSLRTSLHSSSSEAYPSWQKHDQCHLQGPSLAMCAPLPESDNSGSSKYSFLTNRHMALSVSQSSGGTFGASRGHMNIRATLSDPPNFNSSQHCKSKSKTHARSKNTHAPLGRTSSIVPPTRLSEIGVSEWFKASQGQHSSLTQHFPAPHVGSMDHAPVSPQSSTSSSTSRGSDCHQEDELQSSRDSFLEEGMRDVAAWLKSLRLHKYSYLFQQMTYERMLSVTEEWLEQQDVTKGARHKIYASILQLRERQNMLRKLEKNIVDEGGPVTPAILEMKMMLNTPIKAFNPVQSVSNCSIHQVTLHQTSPPHFPPTKEIVEGDLPAQLFRLMGKVYRQLLAVSRPNDECCQSYLHLIDKCVQHEAFSSHQKNLMLLWKHKIWQPSLSQNFGNRLHKVYSGSTTSLESMPLAGQVTSQTGRTLGPGSEYTSQSFGSSWSFGQRSVVKSGGAHSAVRRLGSLNNAFVNTRGMLEPSPAKQPVSRTRSAPINRLASFTLQGSEDAKDTEINNQH